MRLDLLQRRDGRYRMVEVKSATRLREHHLTDVAIQAWVVEGCGLPVDVMNVAVIDPTFVYRGGRRLSGTCCRRSPSRTRCVPSRRTSPDWVRGFKELLDGPEPAIRPGASLPTPVRLPLPLGVRAAAGGGTRWAGRRRRRRPTPPSRRRDPAAAAFLRRLPYPRFYLDFETVQFGVPVWPGMRPYEQLLFQWSCHVEPAAGELTHDELLDLSGKAPISGSRRGAAARARRRRPRLRLHGLREVAPPGAGRRTSPTWRPRSSG